MKHDAMCAIYGYDNDPGPRNWGYEPPVRPCDCVRFTAIRRDERANVEHRIRQSGIARWMGAAQWDALIGCIRGQG